MISVAICTYNRAELLENALQSLVRQTLDADRFEIIVVDNASTDHTRQVVHDMCQAHPQYRIFYVFEAKIGLPIARNRGWEAAQGKYVAFLDDDCTAPADWLEKAEAIIKEYAPAVFGGAFHAFYLTPKPHWFLDAYGSSRNINHARPLQPGEYFIYGNNMVCERDTLQKLGGFAKGFGMKGTQLGAADEVELQHRLQSLYPEELVYFDPDFFVYHLVKPERMRLRTQIRLHFINGQYLYHARSDQALRSKLRIGLHTLRIVIVTLQRFVLYGILFRNREQYPRWQNYVYEQVLERVFWLGILYGEFNRPVPPD